MGAVLWAERPSHLRAEYLRIHAIIGAFAARDQRLAHEQAGHHATNRAASHPKGASHED